MMMDMGRCDLEVVEMEEVGPSPVVVPMMAELIRAWVVTGSEMVRVEVVGMVEAGVVGMVVGVDDVLYQ